MRAGSKAAFVDLDRRAIAPPGQGAVLVPAQLGQAVREPQPGADQRSHEYERRGVNEHAVTVIVGLAAASVFGEIVDRRPGRPSRTSRTAAELENPVFAIRRRRAIIGHGTKSSTQGAASGRLSPGRRKLEPMTYPFRSRRIVALVAAYVVAFQALLLPLSVAPPPPDASLCASASSASPHSGDGHGTGCPCAAGCGAQCCVNAVAGPPPAIVVLAPAAIASHAPPPVIVSAARPHLHSPQLARAPPAA